MNKLYEISTELCTAIEKYSEATTQEQLDEVGQSIEALNLAFQDKALSVGYYCLNEQADIVAIQTEVQRLESLMDAKTKKVEWLKNYIKNQMEYSQIQKVESSTLKLAIQNNPKSVVIDDESKVSDVYKKFTITLDDPKYLEAVLLAAPNSKVTSSISKTEIKKALEAGVGVEGSHIEQKTRLVIK